MGGAKKKTTAKKGVTVAERIRRAYEQGKRDGRVEEQQRTPQATQTARKTPASARNRPENRLETARAICCGEQTNTVWFVEH